MISLDSTSKSLISLLFKRLCRDMHWRHTSTKRLSAAYWHVWNTSTFFWYSKPKATSLSDEARYRLSTEVETISTSNTNCNNTWNCKFVYHEYNYKPISTYNISLAVDWVGPKILLLEGIPSMEDEIKPRKCIALTVTWSWLLTGRNGVNTFGECVWRYIVLHVKCSYWHPDGTLFCT